MRPKVAASDKSIRARDQLTSIFPRIEREVKRANRDLLQQVSKMDDMQKIELLMKRSSELLADMRRLERENQKNKKRGDALQKERDASRTELSKTVGLKEKLEKLCRELQRDNNKMKVRTDRFEQTITEPLAQHGALTLGHRMRTRSSRVRRSEITPPGTRNSQACYQNWRDTKRKRTPQRNK